MITFYRSDIRQIILLVLLLPLLTVLLHAQTPSHEIREADSPLERCEWELLRAANPQTRAIPENIRGAELEFAKSLPFAPPQGLQITSKTAATAGVSMQFAPIGPYNVGGRTRAFAQDVSNPNILLAGGVTGGVWRSVNGGESWTKTLPANEFQNVSCIAQDKRPGKTNVWYMGTGEVLSTTDRRTSTNFRTILTGTGIYKSTDGGVSWNLLPATKTASLRPNVLANPFQGVWDIAVNPANSAGDEVLAACYGGIMRSSDGGENWSKVLGDSAKPCFNSTLVISPDGVMYSALSAGEFGARLNRYGIYRSTDGINWANISPANLPDSLRRFRLALAPSNPNILYILTQKPRTYSGIYTNLFNQLHTFWQYRYRQGDGTGAGGSWENRSGLFTMRLPNESGRTFSSLSGYCLALAVKPDDENTVLIAGSNAYYSTNGFADTMRVKHLGGYPYIVEPPGSLHPDVHNLVFDAVNPNKLYSANDGGIDALNDITKATARSWKSLNNGYTCTQFYGIALDHRAPGDGRAIGGLQDNSSFLTTTSASNERWAQLSGGDGCVPALRHKNSIAITSAQSGYTVATMLGTPKQDQIYLATDSIAHATPMLFVTNPLLDPWEENTLYIPARNRLFAVKNLDRLLDTSNYEKMFWELLPAVEAAIPQSHFISAVAASEGRENTLILGTHLGKVFTAETGAQAGSAVREITSPLFPANSFVSSVSVDSKDPDLMLVAFSNYSVQSLFATTDGGVSWAAVAGNLEMNSDGSGWGPSVRCAKILRKGGDIVYVAGTSIGLFATQKLEGAKTEWVQQGITTIGNLTVEAMDYRESDGRLIAGTHGGGAFATNMLVGVESEAPQNAFSLEQNYPNPVQDATAFYFTLNTAANVRLTLTDLAGKEIFTLAEGLFPAGRHKAEAAGELISNLASGSYYYQLRAGRDVLTRLMTVVK